MASRLAACEPCRKSKLGCDHQQPVCTRCRRSNRSGLCTYRATPFKRRKTNSEAGDTSRTPDFVPSPEPTLAAGSSSYPKEGNRYPNPGYIGSSSHVAIFNHITPPDDQSSTSNLKAGTAPRAAPRSQPDDELLVQRCADALNLLFTRFSSSAMKELIKFWCAKGANLALTGAIVNICVDSIDLPPLSTSEDWHLPFANQLLANSARLLEFSQHSNFVDYCSQFRNQNIRWETLGIFVSAVIRATMDIPFFPSLYATEENKYSLQRLCTRVADYALEITLSLDYLNDLQLFLQYENFIVHSYVDGDHSYYSWRKLGDVISSICALGYHENLDERSGTPPFLTELRKAVFALVYSADKNVAIFVGRPPRMLKQFCHFQAPSCPPPDDVWLLSSTEHGGEHDIPHWSPLAKASYMAESRWTALCASIKEDILNLQRDRLSNTELFSNRAANIKAMAEENYSLLPRHFQLRTNIRECSQEPFECDFIGSIRLNHLHVLFLLNMHLLNTPNKPNPAIIDTAEQILCIIVDMILLRNQLTNSGTSLVWKIAYYGLPAAGILLLALLNERATSNTPRVTRPRTHQHLTILAAELQAGSIIRPREPNFELISKAMQTIQCFLDSDMQVAPVITLPDPLDTDWSSQQPWDFEIGFWESLAEHPLLSLDPGLIGHN